MLHPPGVLNHIPVHPSHHIATVPGFTSSFSISSFSQVPHYGNVLMIQFSLVISSILLTLLPPSFYDCFLFRYMHISIFYDFLQRTYMFVYHLYVHLFVFYDLNNFGSLFLCTFYHKFLLYNSFFIVCNTKNRDHILKP